MASPILRFSMLALVIGSSFARNPLPQKIPKGRDYEVKVMIFHDNPPPFGDWNPEYGQPFSEPLGHPVTKQDLIDHISKGLLRRRLNPTQIEAEKYKVNQGGVQSLHNQNIFREHQKQSAHHLLEEMRLARAAEWKKQHELKEKKKKKEHQRQRQPKYQPSRQRQKQQQQKQRSQPARPRRPMSGNRG